MNYPPGLIIPDIILPRINGIAFMSDLKMIEAARDIPVIMISGIMVDDATKREGMLLDAVALNEKPMDMENLVVKVCELLGTDAE